MNKGLRAVAAAAGLSLLTAFSSANDVSAANASGERYLNSREITMAREIFGNRMDYTKVRVRNDHTNRSRAFDGVMRMSRDKYSHDYSAAPLSQRLTFMHEMTHMLQEQHGVNVVDSAIGLFFKNGGDYNKSYDYDLSLTQRFSALNIEQQGALIEDYYFLRETTSIYNKRYNCPSIEQYERVLKPVFRNIQTPSVCR